MSNLRRINLLPPEIGAERSQTKVKVVVIVANVVLLALLGLLYVMKTSEVSNARQELSVQENKNQQVKSQVNSSEFQTVVQKDQDRNNRVKTLSDALVGEISFPRLMNEVSLMLPNNVWLKSLSIDSGKAAGGAPKAGGATTGGSASAGSGVAATFQAEGAAKCDHDYTADWLDRMGALPSVSYVWVSDSAKQVTAPGTPCLTSTFTSSGKLSEGIQTVRSRMLAEGRLP